MKEKNARQAWSEVKDVVNFGHVTKDNKIILAIFAAGVYMGNAIGSQIYEAGVKISKAIDDTRGSR